MLIFAFANGLAREERTPVSENSKGPSTLMTLQFFSDFISLGTLFSEQTIDISLSVLLIEKNESLVAHKGICEFLSKRQTATRFDIILRESFGLFIASACAKIITR